MGKIKGLGKYESGAMIYNFDLDGRSDHYKVKGKWKQYYKKRRRREENKKYTLKKMY